MARPNSRLELTTRLIALASIGNARQMKFIYGLNINAVDKMRLTDLIRNTIEEIPCPYDLAQFSIPGLKAAIKTGENQQSGCDCNCEASSKYGTIEIPIRYTDEV